MELGFEMGGGMDRLALSTLPSVVPPSANRLFRLVVVAGESMSSVWAVAWLAVPIDRSLLVAEETVLGPPVVFLVSDCDDCASSDLMGGEAGGILMFS